MSPRMISYILSMLSTSWVHHICKTAYDILYPHPEKISLYGAGPTYQACLLMLDYADYNDHSFVPSSPISLSSPPPTFSLPARVTCEEAGYGNTVLRLRIQLSCDTDDYILEDRLSILLYIAKLCKSLPRDPLEVCKNIQAINTLGVVLDHYVEDFRETSTWALGYDNPSVVDFTIAASLDMHALTDVTREYLVDLYNNLEAPYPFPEEDDPYKED